MCHRHSRAPEDPAPQAAQAYTLTPGSTWLEPHGPRLKHWCPLSLTTHENPDLRAWTASKPLQLSSELGRLSRLRNDPTAGDKNTHQLAYVKNKRAGGDCWLRSQWGSEGPLASSAPAADLGLRDANGPGRPSSTKVGSLLGTPGGSLAPGKSTYESKPNTKAGATRSGIQVKLSVSVLLAGSDEVT